MSTILLISSVLLLLSSLRFLDHIYDQHPPDVKINNALAIAGIVLLIVACLLTPST